jgi:hypothetical protein
MKIGDSFGHVDKWREICSYLDRLLPRHRVFLFLDALGNPIPNAEVQVFRQESPRRRRQFAVEPPKELAATALLDQNGLLKIARQKWHRSGCGSFILSHADYGIAVIDKRAWKSPCIWVPLVRSGSDAEKYGIEGLVVDEVNRPIAGVKISCASIITLGGGKIRWHDWWATVLTDQQGTFRMCMSVSKLDDEIERIPPGSKYGVSARAPSQFLYPSRGWKIPCGGKTVIKLERPQLYFRTFVFEDANGPITDPNLLDSILLYIKPRGMNQLPLMYSELKDGGWFPAGSYSGLVNEHGKSLWFEPMEVTEDSPEQLVFKPKAASKPALYTLCAGRAVYGFTNRPAQGAFVLATTSTKNIFATAMITDEQWSSLRRLGTDPSVDEPALEPLHRVWEFDKILRTDAEGRFQISIPRDIPYCLFVAEKGYVPVYHWTTYLENDPNEHVELPVLRLLPAAKVSFSATLVSEGKKEVYMAWNMPAEEPTDWTSAWTAYISTRPISFPLQSRIQCNNTYTLCVPVGPIQRLSFKIWEKGEYSAPVYTENFRPEQGQTVDLGEIDLTPRIGVYVQVVDWSGQPIEGVAVSHCRVYGHDYRYFGQKHITDAQGLAEFLVPPNYRADFAVGDDNDDNNCGGESISYETNGPQDANIVYTLQLSDEMLQCLFK